MAPATIHICSHSVGMGRNKKYIFRLDVTVDDAPVVAVPEPATGLQVWSVEIVMRGSSAV